MADDIQFTNDSNDFGTTIGTSPGLGFQASDILHTSNTDGGDGDSSSFTGIGDIGLGLSLPTVIGVSSSSDSQDYSSSDNNDGGLLGGLL
jgi:hypothetical protein